MIGWMQAWWSRLPINRKFAAVLVAAVSPLIIALGIQTFFVDPLQEIAFGTPAIWTLVAGAVGTVALGWAGLRLLASSIARPISLLRSSVRRSGEAVEEMNGQGVAAIQSSDEVGQLARALERMTGRVRVYIRELEAISDISHEINTIGPDGLDGVLRRITERAAELLEVDICVVMLRNERMGCWVIEAASGHWWDRLHKRVMLWEEFPVSVRAFETRKPAIGEDLRKDQRPEVSRRNLMGESMLSLPLLSQGAALGVLGLIQGEKVPRNSWNVRLASGFAEEAALAIANARLYDAAQRKGKKLQLRLKKLEHLAETLAHDLKGPGERMKELASLLLAEYENRFDEKARRWLALLDQNGRELTARADDILKMARIGTRHDVIEAVDPAEVVTQVIKANAGDLEQRGVRVDVQRDLPFVACHRAYLHQVFDNLLSNAITYSCRQPQPRIRVSAIREEGRVRFFVIDNGMGIPAQHRTRVFEPFVRLNPGSTKGSGIGLSIVKRIVELYEGKVWIESNDGVGCRVVFTLPALGQHAPEPPLRGSEVYDTFTQHSAPPVGRQSKG